MLAGSEENTSTQQEWTCVIFSTSFSRILCHIYFYEKNIILRITVTTSTTKLSTKRNAKETEHS